MVPRPIPQYLQTKDLVRQRHESIRSRTVCSRIVYSVRIGPPQPRFSFISATSTNPATIGIDNFRVCIIDCEPANKVNPLMWNAPTQSALAEK
jgi:hypothetical protein